MKYPFRQVDVFGTDGLKGNPLAVVHAAQGLSDSKMAALARWTHLSETIFLLPPEKPSADYRVRIFTPDGELPFAGHPTLGACHAWLAAGGKPHDAAMVLQQCGVGIVRIRREHDQLAFAAPPLRRTGPLALEILSQIANALGLTLSDIQQHQWVDNGPGWCAVMLASADAVFALTPDWNALYPLNLGVIGPQPPGHTAAFEVRAFIGDGGYEDPVTGSLNASLAQWLIPSGLAPPAYFAAQGTKLQRSGQIQIHSDGTDVWVGGNVQDIITGTVDL